MLKIKYGTPLAVHGEPDKHLCCLRYLKEAEIDVLRSKT